MQSVIAKVKKIVKLLKKSKKLCLLIKNNKCTSISKEIFVYETTRKKTATFELLFNHGMAVE